jgi:hypothetical protein
MAKKTRDSILALVLEVIAQVYELSGRRTQPWYIDRAALDWGHAPDSVDSSIYYAEVSGWLRGQWNVASDASIFGRTSRNVLSKLARSTFFVMRGEHGA